MVRAASEGPGAWVSRPVTSPRWGEWLLVAALAAGLVAWLAAPGPMTVFSLEEPAQQPAGGREWRVGEWTLASLAAWRSTVRVLSVARYRWDRFARLCPVDLAVGWGVWGDPAWFSKVSVWQSDRWFFCRWKARDRPENGNWEDDATNIHILPAYRELLRQCETLRRGDLVVLEGVLVQAAHPRQGVFASSLSRRDHAGGACEILWLETMDCLGR